MSFREDHDDALGQAKYSRVYSAGKNCWTELVRRKPKHQRLFGGTQNVPSTVLYCTFLRGRDEQTEGGYCSTDKMESALQSPLVIERSYRKASSCSGVQHYGSSSR